MDQLSSMGKRLLGEREREEISFQTDKPFLTRDAIRRILIVEGKEGGKGGKDGRRYKGFERGEVSRIDRPPTRPSQSWGSMTGRRLRGYKGEGKGAQNQAD